jgi:ribosomal protein L9
MKVLLLDNVKDIGKKGAVVTVADGMARNKLIPLKKAIEATPANIQKYQHITVSATTPGNEKVSIKHILDTHNIAEVLLTSKADGTGSLFKSIHEKDILAVLYKHLPKHLHGSITESAFSNFKALKKIGSTIITLGDAQLRISIANQT